MAEFGFGSWEAGQTIPFEVESFLFLVRKTVGKDRYSWYVRSLEHLIPAPLAKASAARRDDLPVLSCCRCSLAGQLSWFVRDSAKFGRRASTLKQCAAQPLRTHAQDMCILAGDARANHRLRALQLRSSTWRRAATSRAINRPGLLSQRPEYSLSHNCFYHPTETSACPDDRDGSQ